MRDCSIPPVKTCEWSIDLRNGWLEGRIIKPIPLCHLALLLCCSYLPTFAKVQAPFASLKKVNFSIYPDQSVLAEKMSQNNLAHSDIKM